jgi:hypothetical protein
MRSRSLRLITLGRSGLNNLIFTFMFNKIKKWFSKQLKKIKYTQGSILVFAGLGKYEKARVLLKRALANNFFLGYTIGCFVVAGLYLLLSACL